MTQVFDRNSDGYISKSELYQTMKELGVRLSMDDLNEMMSAADINQDGRIDYAGDAFSTGWPPKNGTIFLICHNFTKY